MGGSVNVYSDSSCTTLVGGALATTFGGICSQHFPAGSTSIWPDFDVTAGIQCTPTGLLLACYGLNSSTCEAAAQDPGGDHLAGGCLNENGDYSDIRSGRCHPDDVDRDGAIDRYLKFECAVGATGPATPPTQPPASSAPTSVGSNTAKSSGNDKGGISDTVFLAIIAGVVVVVAIIAATMVMVRKSKSASNPRIAVFTNPAYNNTMGSSATYENPNEIETLA
jgi:hypothetical protein